MGGTEADDDGNGHRQDRKSQGQLPDAVHLVVRLQVGDADDDRRKTSGSSTMRSRSRKTVPGSFAPVEDRCRERRGWAAIENDQADGNADGGTDQDSGVEGSGKIMRSGSGARRWVAEAVRFELTKVALAGFQDRCNRPLATLPKGADDNTSQMVTRLHVIALQLSSPFSSLTAVST